MEKSEFVKQQQQLKAFIDKRIGKEIEKCKHCEGISDWGLIPFTLQRHYTPCTCIKCSCGKKDFNGDKTITLKFDDIGNCLGYCCSKCKKENVTKLKQLELIMLSKDQEDVV